MARLHFTPWKESSQLLLVRGQFYPGPSYDGPEMRAEACSLVWAWRTRGNLPHAVESTALLTEAILHDDASKQSVFSIRATYAAVFCRFVTGLVDSKIHGKKQTMYQKAMSLGLPASFVELRHEATHRDLPSLVVLRSAAQRSMEWLWQFYWVKVMDVNSENVVSLEPQPCHDISAVRISIRHILQSVSAAEDIIGTSRNAKMSGLESPVDPVHKPVTLCRDENQVTRATARVLIDHGQFVLANRTPGSLMDRAFSPLDGILMEISRHRSHFLTVLLEEMTRSLASPGSLDPKTEPYREAMYVWVEHILTSNTWATVRRRYLSPGFIVAVCRDSPGHLTDRVLSLLENLPDNPNEDEKTSGSCSSMITATRRQDASDLESDAVTASQLDHLEKDNDDLAVLRNYGWNIDDNWKFKPIGIV